MQTGVLTSYFNSRPSARGDRLGAGARYRMILFQFTPLREGRLGLGDLIVEKVDISIHAPPRGATYWEGKSLRMYFISIHAPPRGATRFARQRGQALHISIHAPPRGATLSIPFYKSDLSISIHAPPRGATRKHGVSPIKPGIFQFTPLREGRHVEAPAMPGQRISIHAPPRGATRSARGSRHSTSPFQFTPLREGRPSGRPE